MQNEENKYNNEDKAESIDETMAEEIDENDKEDVGLPEAIDDVDENMFPSAPADKDGRIL